MTPIDWLTCFVVLVAVIGCLVLWGDLLLHTRKLRKARKDGEK